MVIVYLFYFNYFKYLLLTAVYSENYNISQVSTQNCSTSSALTTLAPWLLLALVISPTWLQEREMASNFRMEAFLPLPELPPVLCMKLYN